MEVYEVSVAQYVAFLNWLGPNGHKTGCQGQPCAFTTLEKPDQSYVAFDGTTYTVVNPDFYSNHPATFVTWWGADEYCRAINRRLPTEAEWERAARGSANNVYPWGFEFDPNRAMSSYPTATGTMPVNEFPNGASPYGVFNLSGNVSEWVWDWYQGDYYTQQLNSPQPNPNGPISGTERVHRGGSWDTKPLFLRAVHRLSRAPGDPTSSIGFRCVADTRPVTQPVVPPAGDNQSGSDSAAPTLPPQPTLIPQPTSTPSGPTPTLNPG
jgi:formylglycine-generating enzyme required for sulfatase activity